jgi:glutamate--cysteine ligase
VASIARYITDGMLYSPSELYYPVRLKPRGENSLKDLLANGVNHIELRMMDVNPLSPIGVMPQDLSFVQLLLVYLSSLPAKTWDANAQRRAIANEKAAARLKESEIWIAGEDGRRLSVKQAALELLEQMERFFASHNKPEAVPILQYQKEKVQDAGARYANQIVEAYGTDYVGRGLELSKEHAAKLLAGEVTYSE